jgi:putative salt-induced outer membrane protein
MRALYALTLCAISASALAQQPPPPPPPPPAPGAPAAPAAAPPDPFVADVALGYLSTKGNTDSTNGNLSFDATWDPDGPWKHVWEALAITARTNDVTTAESYSAGYQAQRDLTERSYVFGALDWRQDRFSGYDRQLSETVGYGWRVIDTPRHTLALEAGVGAKQSDLVTGEELDEGIITGGLDYLLRISENSEFHQELKLEQGDDNRYFESTSELKTNIVGNLALVLSYVIKSNSDVPVGIEKTDRFTAISLEYGF